MSRYPPAAEYRGFRDRSRSPPRFSESHRRGSAAAIFENRPPGPVRNATDLPRGPRQQFDGPPRQITGAGPAPGPGSRPGYSSLRDAPPLGTPARPFREREYDRPALVPSPRERSPARGFKDARDFPPRELEIPRVRRDSRDGPPSAGSGFADNPPFAPGPPRGGFARGRGRGDFEFRGGRAGRRHFDDREPFRRERSPPPPRWGREPPRDERDLERRDDRRFDRRDDERRPEWLDREREPERTRREQPTTRLESRRSDESIASGPAPQQASQAIQIDPGRLALLQEAGEDVVVRRPYAAQSTALQREVRRDVPETPSYLNGRAENTANRYKQRGSSPPTQAPPVPAFTLSFAPQGPTSSSHNGVSPAKPIVERKASLVPSGESLVGKTAESFDAPINAPVEAQSEAKAPPPSPRADLMEPPPTAPKAPKALEAEMAPRLANRLHGVRSLETVPGPPHLSVPQSARGESFAGLSPPGPRPISPTNSVPSMSTLMQPVSPSTQTFRQGEIAPPTGPRAARASPAMTNVLPRTTYTSPRSDAGVFQGYQGPARVQTPPPTAPSGPRNKSFSVSPKVTSSAVPTAPRGSRVPPTAPRASAAERPLAPPIRGPDRLGGPPPWAPPTAPRGLQRQPWRRPGQPPYSDKIIPAKRDSAGDERDRQPVPTQPTSGGPTNVDQARVASMKDEREPQVVGSRNPIRARQWDDRMDIDHEQGRAANLAAAPDQSATARQSFFGMSGQNRDPEASMSALEEENPSSDEDADPQQGLALFQAKYEREKRALESQLTDLSARKYRATTPLESIARLSCISDRDLQRARESHERSEDRSPTLTEGNLVPPTTHSSGTDEGGDLLTPKGEEEVSAVEVNSSGGESTGHPRIFRRPSPEVISLPYLTKEPHLIHNNGQVRESLRRQEESRPTVLTALGQEMDMEDADEEEAEEEFEDSYKSWREQCEDLDRQREEQERLKRQISVDPAPEMVVPSAPPLNPMTEGSRRLHKYSSEYDVEQVLKQSEETARLEQEKHEREARKNQADMEKEAKIPDQHLEEHYRRSIFIDTNRYREPGKLTLVFSYEPQPDTFTENEQQIFIAAFKETPKKWGEIASLLPGRTYKDCIHHYYSNKWDGRFRDSRTKKLKASGRRGRGGKAIRGRGAQAMADLAVTTEPAEKSESGRPKRAAAPTTFGEREIESKAALVNPSPAKKLGPGARQDGNGDNGPEKPGKRRKGMGEKPGRKAKGSQPLAALAAAPSASPGRSMMQSALIKEDMARAQSMEEASLLTGFRAEQHTMHPVDKHAYQQEEYHPTMMPMEDIARPKIAGQVPPSRTGPSSYWSVPEQTDFVKYIGYFGTDFAAIANHMGTKTQTMIKNHYSRQVAHGNQPDLERSAREADRKREMGEDVGPPPIPTPIVKRKYDQPQTNAQRSLAPQADAMDIDEPTITQRPSQAKHASPPQYQAQPRFSTSAQATPVQVHRVMASPALTGVSPVVPKIQASAPVRPGPHPLGAGLSFTPDSRPDSRADMQANTSARRSQPSIPRSQPQSQNAVPDAYILELQHEQERATRLQQQELFQRESLDMQRQNSFHRGSAHGSPVNPPLHEPMEERKPLLEERAPTPPRNIFGQSPYHRSAFRSDFGSMGSSPALSMLGRPPLQPSPKKKDDLRPASVPVMPPMQTAVVPSIQTAPIAPPEPKRSNLLSILNDDPPEIPPPKRESLPSMQQRGPSPAQKFAHQPGSAGPTPPAASAVQALRRETFGQPSMPQSHFRRPSLSQQGPSFSSNPSASIKQEAASTASILHAPNSDWAAHVLSRDPQPAPPRQPSPFGLERDPRPIFPPRGGVLGGLNQPIRAVPSPPPHGSLSHSRTSSVTMQQGQGSQSREQRFGLPGHQGLSGLGGPGQTLHPNPYGQQSVPNPFEQAPSSEGRNHAHHSHNNSLSGSLQTMHHRGSLREDAARQQELQAQQAQRQHEAELGWRREDMRLDERRMDEMRMDEMRRRDEMIRAERQDEMMRDDMMRRGERNLLFERQQQQQQHFFEQQQRQRQDDEMRDRDRQQQFMSRGPPPPMQPQAMQPQGFSGGPPFGLDRIRTPSLRDQAARETEAAMRHEAAQRMGGDVMFRDRDHNRVSEREHAEGMRRHEEAMFRRTPLQQAPFGHPPPPPRRG
ncbi:hypothetical protein LTR86_002750 [Recurvomyces mirabilis]|nr:hypothetical protein LTR86_002750 [Recurvomyces mirabilis]